MPQTIPSRSVYIYMAQILFHGLNLKINLAYNKCIMCYKNYMINFLFKKF
jgi:hypothetical protein